MKTTNLQERKREEFNHRVRIFDAAQREEAKPSNNNLLSSSVPSPDYLQVVRSVVKFLFCLTLFAATLAATLAACSLDKPTSPSGYGYFSMQMNETVARTILPQTELEDFAKFVLEFVYLDEDGVDDVVEPRTYDDLNNPVTLRVGTWNLTVSAFLDADDTLPAAVSEAILFDIEEGLTTTPATPVVLNAIMIGTGTGAFEWKIDFPDDAVNPVSVTITITPMAGSDPFAVINGAGKEGVRNNIPVGQYTVLFTLERKDYKTLNLPQVMRVYRNMTSRFPASDAFDFSDYFLYGFYDITFESNGGSFVHALPVVFGQSFAQTIDGIDGAAIDDYDPIRSGYIFDGWYTDAALTELFDFNTPINRQYLLYAKWKVAPVPFTITYAHLEDPTPLIVGDTLTLSKTGQGYPTTVELSVENNGYHVTWRVLGTNPVVGGTGNTFTLNASNPVYGVGVERSLVMTIDIDGTLYNRTITFMIRQSAPYVITGTGTFTARLGEDTDAPLIGTGSIQDVIEAIKADANRRSCEIQFGTGAALNIGATGIIFEGGDDWGSITLLGGISATSATAVTLRDGVSIDVNCNITATTGMAINNTSNGEIIIRDNVIITSSNTNSMGTITVGAGTLTMYGGIVRSTANQTAARAIVATMGTINIRGGTVGSMSADVLPVGLAGMAISMTGGTINISGADTLITSGNTSTTSGTINLGTGTLTMTGGIVRNTANDANAVNARAIGATTGTVNIQGGTVGAMTADGVGTAGAAIGKTGANSITISGADTLITSANTTTTSGTILISGTGSLIMNGGTVRNTADSENARAIYSTSTGTLTINGGTVSVVQEDTAYAVYNNNDNSVLTIEPSATIKRNVHPEWGGILIDGKQITGPLAQIINAIPVNTPTTIILTDDITVPSAITVGTGKDITIVAGSADVTISTQGSGFRVNSGGSLTLGGSGTGTLTLHSNNAANVEGNGNGVYVNGEFVMNENVVITGFHNTNAGTAGAGVFVETGIFTMNGGIIENNISQGYGGGVVIAGTGGTGTFIMNDGIIKNNEARAGGGVHVYRGNFTMYGGTISGNHATGTGTDDGGGGVSVSTGVYISTSGGYLTLYGGTIYGSDAEPPELANTTDHTNGSAALLITGSGEKASYGNGDIINDNIDDTIVVEDGARVL